METTPISLIGTPISHYVQTVILCCEERGLPYRLRVEGHDTPAALKSPAHRRWHPFGKIPAIEHRGRVLYETSAICRYLDRIGEGPALVPAEPWAAARMEQWISAVNSYFHPACISRLVGQYVFPRGEGGRPDRAVIETALPEVDAALAELAKAYDGVPFLAGERLSLADLFVVPVIRQLGRTPEGRVCLARFPVIGERLGALKGLRGDGAMAALFERYLPEGHGLDRA